jgi:hypothetical protein
MSPILVADRADPNPVSIASAPYFLLGLNVAGLWVIRETSGTKGGLFRTREAAIKYARDESLNGNFTILHQPDGLELERQDLRRAA